jgi:hypothetical protein
MPAICKQNGLVCLNCGIKLQLGSNDAGREHYNFREAFPRRPGWVLSQLVDKLQMAMAAATDKSIVKTLGGPALGRRCSPGIDDRRRRKSA